MSDTDRLRLLRRIEDEILRMHALLKALNDATEPWHSLDGRIHLLKRLDDMISEWVVLDADAEGR